MEYSELIPDKAPEDLIARLTEQSNAFKKAILSFKSVGREEAEALTHCETCGGDYRRNHKGRAALLWCSECEKEIIVEYLPGQTCHGCGTPNGIYVSDDYHQHSGEFKSGDNMCCPRCGAEGTLYNAAAMKYGHTDQGFMVVPTVAAGCAVFTQWCVERHVYRSYYRYRAEFTVSPWQAYVVDGKKVIKLVHYRRNMYGSYYNLGQWEQMKRLVDTMGVPYLYPATPDLGGTSLENAKLWEYKAQAYSSDHFAPIAYARLYLRRNNVENLITSGLGNLIGEMITDEAQDRQSYYSRTEYRSPVLPGINWKKKKPNEMLGITRTELRTIRSEGWGVAQWNVYDKHRDAITLPDAVEALHKSSVHELNSILAEPINSGLALRVIHYLEKQRADYVTYKDYLHMAGIAGEDINDPVIRWPPHLRAAHDRLTTAVNYKNDQEKARKFADMSERCAGLCWEYNGICIRPAATPEELVAEGKALHHCVGGYSENHTRGNIILFIRHARRPERSWYTLNVDVINKRIIQNHGYGNETSPRGKRLTIRPEVQEFVKAWEEQKLKPFKLPPLEGETKKRKTRTKATGRRAAAVAEQ